MGFVAIDGYDRYRTYYKELLDKLGVEVNLFRVGAYKSAAEVLHPQRYVARGSRGEPRVPECAVDQLPQAVAEARGLTPDAIGTYVDNSVPALPAAKGDAAKVALDAKLVTGLKYRSKSNAAWSTRRRGYAREDQAKVEADESDSGESFNSISLEDYLRVVHAEKQARTPASRRSASSSPRARSSTVAAAGHGRRRVHRAADPRCAPGRRRQGHRAAGQIARAAACSPPSRSTARCVRAAAQRQARGGFHGRSGGLGRLLHRGFGR